MLILLREAEQSCFVSTIESMLVNNGYWKGAFQGGRSAGSQTKLNSPNGTPNYNSAWTASQIFHLTSYCSTV